MREWINHQPFDSLWLLARFCLALQVVPEPVHKWQNIQGSNGGETFNLLEAFYNEPGRFAYTFQNYVFVTRLIQARVLINCPVKIL